MWLLICHLVGCWLQRCGLPALTVLGEAGGWSRKPPSERTVSRVHVTIRPIIRPGGTAAPVPWKSRCPLQDPDSVSL